MSRELALRIAILGKKRSGQLQSRESVHKSVPVESIPSRAGVGDGDDGTSRSSKGAWVSVVRSTATVSDGGVNVIGTGGVNAEGSGVNMLFVFGKVSISCVVPATGADEVPGLQGYPVAV